jgi:hypothetical protein
MPQGGSDAHERSQVARDFLRRLDEVEQRLATHAAATAPQDRLTDADPGTGERWEWGQVWAHLAEFIPYWLGQAREVLAAYRGDPVPFGRVKSNPERVAAVERDRGTAVAVLWERLQSQVGGLRTFVEELPDGGWVVRGVHQTLGEMSMHQLVDEFLVGHLEQHVDQLDSLRRD